MKSILSLLLFASVALAQSAVIGLPKKDAAITPGQDLIVQIQRPDSLSGSTEIGIAIGLSSCPSSPCYPARDIMGTILYHGPFTPQFHNDELPPYQNFSVKIPANTEKGHAQINFAHATLIGAGPFPLLQTMNHTVFVI